MVKTFTVLIACLTNYWGLGLNLGLAKGLNILPICQALSDVTSSLSAHQVKCTTWQLIYIFHTAPKTNLYSCGEIQKPQKKISKNVLTLIDHLDAP